MTTTESSSANSTPSAASASNAEVSAMDSRRLVQWTIAMAIASWVLAGITLWGMIDQSNNARELLHAQIDIELEKEFDSPEMRLARSAIASALLNHSKDVADYRVIDFLDKVGMYVDQGRIDEDTAYRSFSYYIERYWVAAKPLVLEFRRLEHDDDYYDDFEELYQRMLYADAGGPHMRKIEPTQDEINVFLTDESHLTN